MKMDARQGKKWPVDVSEYTKLQHFPSAQQSEDGAEDNCQFSLCNTKPMLPLGKQCYSGYFHFFGNYYEIRDKLSLKNLYPKLKPEYVISYF